MSWHSCPTETLDGHAPVPGPDYWSFRCLVCGHNVSHHPPWWIRLWLRVRLW